MRRLGVRTCRGVLLSLAIAGPLFTENGRAQDGGESWSSPQEQVTWWKNLYELFPTDHVQPDFAGLAKERFRPPPEPYTHPRVYFNPEEVPDIRRRLQETEMGRAASSVIREFVARSLTDNEVFDGLAAGRTDKVFEDKLEQARWSLSIAMLYQGFLCLIDDDRTAAEKLARALTEMARRVDEQLENKPTSADGDWLRGLPPEIKDAIPAGQDWRTEVQGIVAHNNLALCYDFIYTWMTDGQRGTVRRMIANSSRDTWSHGMGVPGLHQGNWQPFHWRAGVQALAIEGEEGFDPKVVESTVRQMTQYYTYFFTKAGAPLEGMGKGSLGTCYLPAFAKRGHWLIAYPGLRRAAGEFLLHSLQPWGGQFHTYGGLGGAAGSVSAARNLLALKYAFPDDPAIDFVFRNAVGEKYESIRDGSVSGHYAQMYFYLYYAIFAEDYHSDPDRSAVLAALDPKLTYVCPERAQLITRSDWSAEALYLQFHIRQLQSSHVRDESGMFSLSALGRIWALYPAVHHRGPFGEAREARYHNVVTIDDACTGSNPGRMIDFADCPLATFATGDHRPAWDWGPASGEPEPAWVDDTSCPNDRIGLASAKRAEPGFDVPWSEHSDWLRVGQKTGRRWKRPHYPVRHAFRSAGLVRGPHPYALVVDDIRKDDAVHVYKWLMQLPHDLDVLDWDWEDSTAGFRADIILHESSPDDAASERRLLVRVLQCAVEDPAVAVNHRRNKPLTPGYIETYPAYGSTSRGRRLVVPSRSIEPRFKVLLFAYREGEQLPSTSWYRDGKKLVVQWHDQRDVFLFDAGQDGRTRFTLQRIDGPLGDVPFALGRPVDEAARTQGNLIGHWTFDAPAGGDSAPLEVPDASGNNHSGKIVGGELVPGVQGRCLRLAGKDRLELSTDVLAPATQAISVCCWLRPARADVPNSRLFNTGVHLRDGFDLNGYAGGVRASGLGDYWLGFTGRKLPRSWHHVVATCSPRDGLATFYVNGRLVSEKEVAGALRFDRATHLIVADGFEGEIDELRVHDYLLDEKEVASIYGREGRYEIGHWGFERLDDGWRLPSDAGYDGVADKVALEEGRLGRAAAFDGQGRITLPKEVVTEHFRGALSVSLWFRTDAETIAGNSHLFNANEHLRNGLWVDFYGRGIRMNAAGGYGRGFSRDVQPNAWNHLVVSYDGTTGSMYLNGRRVAQNRFFGEFTLGRELTLGGQGYRGKIDDVRLFTYPLPAEEVQQLFRSESENEVPR